MRNSNVSAEIDRIKRDFSYITPTSAEVTEMVSFRGGIRDMALAAVGALGSSRETSLVITHLEQAVMYFNAGLVRNRPDAED